MGATTIGSALAERRRELTLEKGQAAKQIGMSRTTYSSYEQDAQRPSTEVFSALAEFLGISVEQFLPLYGATCVAQARVSLGRAVPQSRQPNETSNESPRSSVNGDPMPETAREISSSREAESTTTLEAESTTTESAPEPLEATSEETTEPEIALEAQEVEDTPEPPESDVARPSQAPEPGTTTTHASSDELNMSWPSSMGKDAGNKKKKKKKKGKKS